MTTSPFSDCLSPVRCSTRPRLTLILATVIGTGVAGYMAGAWHWSPVVTGTVLAVAVVATLQWASGEGSRSRRTTGQPDIERLFLEGVPQPAD